MRWKMYKLFLLEPLVFDNWNSRFPTMGFLAFAAFLTAIFSGVILAVPFNINAPFDSIQLFLITNPYAGFVRSLHYWSAQLFLILTLIHIYEYLLSGRERNMKGGPWFRLGFTIPALFFVMISGFILKGDAEAIMARQILCGLLESIPLVGKDIGYGVVGGENDFQLIYVHHICTATIILWIEIIEHSRIFWPRARVIVNTFCVSALLATAFPVFIHNRDVEFLRGPWYFAGMQEIMHWITNPLTVMMIILLLFFIYIALPFVPQKSSSRLKVVLLNICIIYLLCSIFNLYFRAPDWTVTMPWNKM